MMARGLAALLILIASSSVNAWVVTEYPWVELNRPLRIDLREAPNLDGLDDDVLSTVTWWNQITLFQINANLSSNVRPCWDPQTDGLDYSFITFQTHACNFHFGASTLGVTISLEQHVGNDEWVRVDSDIIINTGPGADGFLTGPGWPLAQRNIRTGIPGTSPSGVSWQEALQDAMAEWNALESAALIGLDTMGDPCARHSNYSAAAFLKDVCGEYDFGSALAVTMRQYRSSGSNPEWRLELADIVFDADRDWDLHDGPLQPDEPWDFRRVALHELGHLLGLNHSDLAGAIMWPTISDTDRLACDDKRGLLSLYGDNPDEACGAPPDRPRWHDWAIYFGADRPLQPDLRRVVAHELGHLVGLEHSDQNRALMWWALSDVDRPLCDDQAGAQWLYGPESEPCIELVDPLFSHGFESP